MDNLMEKKFVQESINKFIMYRSRILNNFLQENKSYGLIEN
jgi:hypothetical protein